MIAPLYAQLAVVFSRRLIAAPPDATHGADVDVRCHAVKAITATQLVVIVVEMLKADIVGHRYAVSKCHRGICKCHAT